jgi:hypothetical protein
VHALRICLRLLLRHGGSLFQLLACFLFPAQATQRQAQVVVRRLIIGVCGDRLAQPGFRPGILPEVEPRDASPGKCAGMFRVSRQCLRIVGDRLRVIVLRERDLS